MSGKFQFVLAGAALAWIGCGDVEEEVDAGPVDAAPEPDGAPEDPDAEPPPDAEPGEADISVTDAEVDPQQVDEGAQALVTATLVNEGDASGEKTLEFTVDGDLEEDKVVSVDAPADGEDAAETEAEFSFSRGEAGDYDIAVNDESAGTVTVVELDVDIVVTEGNVDPDEVGLGEEATVTATVQNQGNVDGERTIEFAANGEFEDSQNVEVDAPGSGEDPSDTEEEVEFTFSREDDEDLGEYDLEVGDEDAGTVRVANLPNYQFVREEEALPSGASSSISASCPDDTVPYSGGARLTGEDGDSENVRIRASAPFEIDDIAEDIGWEAQVSNEGSEDKTIEVVAVCGPAGEDYEIVEEEVTLSEGEFDRLTPTCSSDLVPFGGGVAVDTQTDPRTRIHESYSETEGEQHRWVVGVSNEEADLRTFTAKAVCRELSRGFLRVRGDTEEIEPEESESFTTRCPGDDHVVLGGGFDAEGDDTPNTAVLGGLPRGDIGLGPGWNNDLLNKADHRAATQEVDGQVLCADR